MSVKNNSETVLDRAQTAYSLGKIDFAKKLYTEVLSQSPQDVEALLGLAGCEIETEDIKEAEKNYRKVVVLDPGSYPAWVGLFNIYTVYGHDQKRAKECLDNCLKYYPNTGLSHTLTVKYYLEFEPKNKQKLQSHIKTALELDPQDWQNHYLMTRIGILNKASQVEINKSFTKALKLNPNSEILHNDYGAYLIDLMQPREAAEHFRTALSINPNLPEAQENLISATALKYPIIKYSFAFFNLILPNFSKFDTATIIKLVLYFSVFRFLRLYLVIAFVSIFCLYNILKFSIKKGWLK